MPDTGFSYPRFSCTGAQRQGGVATLAITVILLVVATLTVLFAGRVGLVEQRLSGVDVRSKEVHAAAVGGLEYAVNLLERLARDSQFNPVDPVFLDPSRWEDGPFGEGARLVVSADSNSDWLPSGTISTAHGERIFYPVSMVADAYEYEMVYTLLTPMDDPDGITPIVIEVAVTARATHDSHVRKTVGVGVALGFSRLFSWSDGVFDAPPIVVEGCITGTIDGQIGVFPGSGPAVATTLGLSGGATLADCLPAGELKECPAGHAGSHSLCPLVAESSLGVAYPEGSLWSTVFGDISRAELRKVADNHPDRMLWVDQDFSHTGWNGSHWHHDVGTAQNPVILFFDESVGCPVLNGGVHIHGIVYFENADCSAHGWGEGVIHGTVAVSGELGSLDANARVVAAAMDFTGGLDDPRFGWTYRLHYAEIPGTWRDFGF